MGAGHFVNGRHKFGPRKKTIIFFVRILMALAVVVCGASEVRPALGVNVGGGRLKVDRMPRPLADAWPGPFLRPANLAATRLVRQSLRRHSFSAGSIGPKRFPALGDGGAFLAESSKNVDGPKNLVRPSLIRGLRRGWFPQGSGAH